MNNHLGRIPFYFPQTWQVGEDKDLSEIAYVELKKMFPGRKVKQHLINILHEASLTYSFHCVSSDQYNWNELKCQPRKGWNGKEEAKMGSGELFNWWNHSQGRSCWSFQIGGWAWTNGNPHFYSKSRQISDHWQEQITFRISVAFLRAYNYE